MSKQLAFISLSGGLDSAVTLAEARDAGFEMRAVGFEYGSKHNVYENAAAAAIAAFYKIPFNLIRLDLDGLLNSGGRGKGSALLKSGENIPLGHYAAENMRRTVVPGRNLIFAAYVAALAENEGASAMFLGVHAGDHHIYPDCRPGFIDSLRATIFFGTDSKIELVAPFLGQTKNVVVRRGLELNVPFGLTRTCYTDQPVACGLCGSCQERLEAFAKNYATDPLDYVTRELLPK